MATATHAKQHDRVRPEGCIEAGRVPLSALSHRVATLGNLQVELNGAGHVPSPAAPGSQTSRSSAVALPALSMMNW
jgi:hypothetical protein